MLPENNRPPHNPDYTENHHEPQDQIGWIAFSSIAVASCTLIINFAVGTRDCAKNGHARASLRPSETAQRIVEIGVDQLGGICEEGVLRAPRSIEVQDCENASAPC